VNNAEQDLITETAHDLRIDVSDVQLAFRHFEAGLNLVPVRNCHLGFEQCLNKLTMSCKKTNPNHEKLARACVENAHTPDQIRMVLAHTIVHTDIWCYCIMEASTLN
jgi:hypothetical protein